MISAETQDYAAKVVQAGDAAIDAWKAAATEALTKRTEEQTSAQKMKTREAQVRADKLAEIAADASLGRTNAEYRDAKCVEALDADQEYGEYRLATETVRGAAQLAALEAEAQMERAKLRRAEVVLLAAMMGGRS